MIAFLYIGAPLIYAKWARILLKRKVKRFNCLVLTFDDGLTPGTRLITAILDILAVHGAKATFFLLGKHMPGREAVVRRIAAEGHEIGVHGYAHVNYLKVHPFRALADIKRGWHAIDTVLGITRHVYPFRPPYGKLNLICLLYLWMRKVPIVYWTFDLGDTQSPNKRNNERIRAVIRESRGEVVLIHDFDRSDESTNRMVLESIRSALAEAKARRMPVLTVSQFFKSYT